MANEWNKMITMSYWRQHVTLVRTQISLAEWFGDAQHDSGYFEGDRDPQIHFCVALRTLFLIESIECFFYWANKRHNIARPYVIQQRCSQFIDTDFSFAYYLFFSLVDNFNKHLPPIKIYLRRIAENSECLWIPILPQIVDKLKLTIKIYEKNYSRLFWICCPFIGFVVASSHRMRTRRQKKIKKKPPQNSVHFSFSFCYVSCVFLCVCVCRETSKTCEVYDAMTPTPPIITHLSLTHT